MNYTDNNFTVTGLLPKVKDVVNLYVSSASTTIGATKDGSFYDLGELFTNKDFKKKWVEAHFFILKTSF